MLTIAQLKRATSVLMITVSLTTFSQAAHAEEQTLDGVVKSIVEAALELGALISGVDLPENYNITFDPDTLTVGVTPVIEADENASDDCNGTYGDGE